MRIFRYIFLLLSALLALHGRSKAQDADSSFADTLIKKINYYRLKNTQGVLYAHFDKTVYINHENVWLTAYLLNSRQPGANDVLSAILVKDDDGLAVLKKRFIMNRGISFGNIFLSDSIAAGNYSFILYTNEVYNGKPANVFVQPVVIRTADFPSFNVSLDIPDTTVSPAGGLRKIRLVTSAQGKTIISGAKVSYYGGSYGHPFASGVVKTDKAGQYIFSVPAKDVHEGDNNFRVQVTYGKESRSAEVTLPVQKDKPVIGFYPEGGNLADGVLTIVGWEARDMLGTPLQTRGVLYKDGKPEDTVYTDAFGLGRFRLIPQLRSRYALKLLAASDTLYQLPGVVAAYPNVTITKAIAEDTLNLVLRAKQMQKIWVVVHNYRRMFFDFSTMATPEGKLVKIILDDLPRGLATVTILDSMHRPCAERLFFAHYSRKERLAISTDSPQYGRRQKVTIDLSLSGVDGKTVDGRVSVACVQATQVDASRSQDIESYFYLADALGRLPEKLNLMGTADADKRFLEELLLVKGWRKYNWNALMQTLPTDTLLRTDSIWFDGRITQFGKPPKKALNFFIMKDAGVKTGSANNDGGFRLQSSDFFGSGNKKVYVFAGGTGDNGYDIKLVDPYLKIDNQVIAAFKPVEFYKVPGVTDSASENINQLMEHIISLKEVKIKGAGQTYSYSLSENACGDYVCLYNILNCPNHWHDPRNRPPVVGEKYRQFDMDNQKLVDIVYSGCNGLTYKNRQAFDGIYRAMSFYPADYSSVNPVEPEYISTIYWNHMVQLNAASKNTISFYTSDITGRFKIIVQGISQDDVVYGEKYFEVSKP